MVGSGASQTRHEGHQLIDWACGVRQALLGGSGIACRADSGMCGRSAPLSDSAQLSGYGSPPKGATRRGRARQNPSSAYEQCREPGSSGTVSTLTLPGLYFWATFSVTNLTSLTSPVFLPRT